MWPIYGTVRGTTNSSQSEPGSNGNQRVVHIP